MDIVGKYCLETGLQRPLRPKTITHFGLYCYSLSFTYFLRSVLCEINILNDISINMTEQHITKRIIVAQVAPSIYRTNKINVFIFLFCMSYLSLV
jgi:hypothetical protein